VRIAHVYSKTGALEAYGKQTQTGVMMGFDYATNGTMMVAGKKITVIEKDDQGKPDVAKSLLATAYGDDKADLAIGPTSSGVALALLPVAEEYKKILLVEPAVADSITGDKWNKYIFRTGRNSSQDAIANAVALDKDGVTIATRCAPIACRVRTSAPALLTTSAGCPLSRAASPMTCSDSLCAPGPCAMTATRQA